MVPPSKSSVFPDARVTTPLVIVASATDPGFPLSPKAYVLAPLAVVGVATTVNRVPEAISALVTGPDPVAPVTVTSPVHPVICPSATTDSNYIVNSTHSTSLNSYALRSMFPFPLKS